MCLREKIGPDPRNFNQRVSLGRNDLLIRTFPKFMYNVKSRYYRKEAKKYPSNRPDNRHQYKMFVITSKI